MQFEEFVKKIKEEFCQDWLGSEECNFSSGCWNCKKINRIVNKYKKSNLKGCGKYETKGTYTFTCGKSSRAGKIQYCKECRLLNKSAPEEEV